MGLIDGVEGIPVGAHGRLLRERLVAEFVGTFFLVLTVGVAAVTREDGTGVINAPVAIGLLLGIQIYTFGTVSGGMFNPAVTLAVFLSRRNKIEGRDAVFYIITQFMGGMIGGFVAFACTETTFGFDYHRNGLRMHPHFEGNGGTSFMLEMIYTWALCQTVLHTATTGDAPNNYFGFAIGCTVLASATSCGAYDQGSFNPAVTWGINLAHLANSDRTGPDRVVDGVVYNFRDPDFASWVIFLFAPLFGSVLAALVFRGTRGNEYNDVYGESRKSLANKPRVSQSLLDQHSQHQEIASRASARTSEISWTCTSCGRTNTKSSSKFCIGCGQSKDEVPKDNPKMSLQKAPEEPKGVEPPPRASAALAQAAARASQGTAAVAPRSEPVAPPAAEPVPAMAEEAPPEQYSNRISEVPKERNSVANNEKGSLLDDGG